MVDYEFYIVIYRGKVIVPDEWTAIEREASAMLARYKRIYTVKGSENAEKMAVCAMAEAMAYHAQAENGALASATIGSVAVSYVTSSSANHSRERQQRDVYQAACLYLGIYRGGLLMLVLQSKSPVDYRLCNQTITVYHADKGTYTRTVHHNAFLDFHKTVTVSKDGSREANNFTLVIPGATIPVSIGDKVLIGVGAECTTREQWAALIPSKASGLVVVQSVNPKYWHGKIVHTEASG